MGYSLLKALMGFVQKPLTELFFAGWMAGGGQELDGKRRLVIVSYLSSVYLSAFLKSHRKYQLLQG